MINIKPEDLIPKYCDLIIIENCMLRCRMCQIWKHTENTDKISIEEWKNFITTLKEFVGNNKMQLQFVGGEPLLKRGIFDLIKFAADKGFSTTMTSNGFIIDEAMAKDIADSRLNNIALSLDSHREEIHDYLRGVKGVYRNLMDAISYLDRHRDKLDINIVTVIMQDNLDDLVELATRVNNDERLSGISFLSVAQPFFTPSENRWYENPEYSFLWPKDIKKVHSVIDELIYLKSNRYKISNPISQLKVFKAYFDKPDAFVKRTQCNLGYNSISVKCTGQIFLCFSVDPIGNIRDQHIKEIWFDKATEAIREKIRNCKENCKLMINCFFEDEGENKSGRN